MPRTKRHRLAELQRMDNVVVGRQCELNWFEKAFGLEQPVVLELGCGQGEYTLAAARKRPDHGVLGVDRNGARLWKGAAQALAEGLANALFLHSMIEYIECHVPPGRVGEIWLPFPDPLPKKRQARHRLLSRQFLERYRRLLAPGGLIHLKTDDMDLIDFAERSVRAMGGRVLGRLNGLARVVEEMGVETTYEKRYRSESRMIYQRHFCFQPLDGSLEHSTPSWDEFVAGK